MKYLKLHLRLPVKFYGFALLAILAAAVAMAPLRVIAQEPAAEAKPETAAPAASGNAQAEPGPAQSEPGPAQSDEEKQVNAFRLEGPVVKWTANTFHLSIEKTADIYEIANFLIIFLAIAVPLARFLPRYLRQRKQKLSDDLESARKMTQDANSRLSAVEAKLAKLDDEIQKFRSEVESESQNDKARITASLEEESKRIVESAEQEIAMAAAQARRGLRTFAADLAIDQAAQKLVLTAENDRALIAEFVGDVLRKGTPAGGKS